LIQRLGLQFLFFLRKKGLAHPDKALIPRKAPRCTAGAFFFWAMRAGLRVTGCRFEFGKVTGDFFGFDEGEAKRTHPGGVDPKRIAIGRSGG
jgi:hypothetical protein